MYGSVWLGQILVTVFMLKFRLFLGEYSQRKLCKFEKNLYVKSACLWQYLTIPFTNASKQIFFIYISPFPMALIFNLYIFNSLLAFLCAPILYAATDNGRSCYRPTTQATSSLTQPLRTAVKVGGLVSSSLCTLSCFIPVQNPVLDKRAQFASHYFSIFFILWKLFKMVWIFVYSMTPSLYSAVKVWTKVNF